VGLTIGGIRYDEIRAENDGFVNVTKEGVLTVYQGLKVKIDFKNNTILIDGTPIENCENRIIPATQPRA
jgi:hypothetical protein